MLRLWLPGSKRPRRLQLELASRCFSLLPRSATSSGPRKCRRCCRRSSLWSPDRLRHGASSSYPALLATGFRSDQTQRQVLSLTLCVSCRLTSTRVFSCRARRAGRSAPLPAGFLLWWIFWVSEQRWLEKKASITSYSLDSPPELSGVTMVDHPAVGGQLYKIATR